MDDLSPPTSTPRPANHLCTEGVKIAAAPWHAPWPAPGAVNAPFGGRVAESGRLRSADAFRARREAAGFGLAALATRARGAGALPAV